MPTVAFISPRAVSARPRLLLACETARGAEVTVIDADPDHPIAAWGRAATLHDNLSIVADVAEDIILDRI
ncbi:MAG TPA: hypothetical protein VF503_03845 [Sphingobium sp.]|uniref:hypothetical protein n=1 Tax=Sphingobium sp. TaxID=1912891 RepID=UPI002ECFAF96